MNSQGWVTSNPRRVEAAAFVPTGPLPTARLAWRSEGVAVGQSFTFTRLLAVWALPPSASLAPAAPESESPSWSGSDTAGAAACGVVGLVIGTWSAGVLALPAVGEICMGYSPFKTCSRPGGVPVRWPVS